MCEYGVVFKTKRNVLITFTYKKNTIQFSFIMVKDSFDYFDSHFVIILESTKYCIPTNYMLLLF